MKILVAEDTPKLAKYIKQMLEEDSYAVDVVEDGRTAERRIMSSSYDAVVLDIMLPEQDGITTCKAVRRAGNVTPILMLTALGEVEDKIKGLDSGADDYLVKPFVMEELLARLRALQRRSPNLQPQILTIGKFSLDYANNALLVTESDQVSQVIPLTTKEFQILTYLMQNADRIISGSKIRNQLWDLNEEPISNVVAAQMRLLRRKLSSYGCECPIETIPSQGYRFNTQP